MSRRLLMLCMSLLSLGGLVHCSKSPQESAQQPAPAAPATAAAPVKATAMTVIQEQQASWIRNFNPLIAPGTARWPTRAGVYEPLMVYNTLKGEFVPWLATKSEWSPDNKKLTLTLRPGVKWSDGTPFTAKDVAFTFELLKKHKALDSRGGVDLPGGRPGRRMTRRSSSALSRAYVPGLVYIAHQPIVPEHKWKDVAGPGHLHERDAGGDRPLHRGEGVPEPDLRARPQPALLAAGQARRRERCASRPTPATIRPTSRCSPVRWTGPAASCPTSSGSSWPRTRTATTTGSRSSATPTTLYVNTAKKPFDDVRVRKAISMAIDRDQIVKVAMYGYTRPSDATALSDAHDRWRNPEAVAAGDWTKFDQAKANALLDEAGLKRGENGMRTLPDKTPMKFDINVVTGWSDWVRAVQLIAQNLKQVGIDANLKTYDFSPYFERIQKGEYDISIGWTSDEPTPYHVYRDLMGTETLRPIGEVSARNWNRFGSKEADALLHAFEGTNDPAEQKKIAGQMQMLFVQNAPAIPLFPGPSWGEYSTRRFTNFPNKDNPYAKLTPNSPPENLFVLVEVKPK